VYTNKQTNKQIDKQTGSPLIKKEGLEDLTLESDNSFIIVIILTVLFLYGGAYSVFK